MDRTVAHIDIDAFFFSVEVLRRPELAGKPVIVAGSGPRAVVTTASYEARKFGIGSAMPAAKARRLCPEALVIAPDIAYYKRMSRRWLELVEAIGVPIQRVSMDECYLELTGRPDPVALMRAKVAEIRDVVGIDASVGIGPNRLVAKMSSDLEKPRGFVVLDQAGAAERFATSAPRLIPGVGPKTAARLEELGVTTIAQLANWPLEGLIERFGERHGRSLHERAHFRDDSPVLEQERKSISVEHTFDADLDSKEEMAEVIAEQAHKLAGLLTERGRRGRTISIKVRLDDFTTVTRAKTLARPTDDPATIERVALDLLRRYGPPRPIRLLGVRSSGWAELGEGSLEGEETPRRAEPQQLVLPGTL